MAEQSSTVQAMNERRKKGELCDFQIKVQGKTFPVHRLVLHTCSEYFRTMFASKRRESNQGFCELEDDEPDVVELCIEFMYTKELDITADMAIKVLKLAHMWQLNKAVETCASILGHNLDATCVLFYRRLASFYDLKNLLSICNEFIFSNINNVTNRVEVADISVSEMEFLLQGWKQHCDTREIPPRYIGYSMSPAPCVTMNTKQENLNFWKFCSKWGQYTEDPTQFCRIVEQFEVEKLLINDFISCVIEERHVKKCEKCKRTVCRTFLTNINTTKEISTENCLVLKNLANCYNLETLKHNLMTYIVQNYQAIFIQPKFNELVPADDFVVYMEHLRCQQLSSEKISIIASWIRFSTDRENIFPRLFKDKPIEYARRCHPNNKEVFKLNDVLFIKSLSHKFNCCNIEATLDSIILSFFPMITKLPESLQLLSKDLIFYLPRLPVNFPAYESSDIWNFTLKWVNKDPDQRKKEFPAIFQALNLEVFSFAFIRETIHKHNLVKECTECTSKLLDFILHKVEILEQHAISTNQRIARLEQMLM